MTQMCEFLREQNENVNPILENYIYLYTKCISNCQQ